MQRAMDLSLPCMHARMQGGNFTCMHAVDDAAQRALWWAEFLRWKQVPVAGRFLGAWRRYSFQKRSTSM